MKYSDANIESKTCPKCDGTGKRYDKQGDVIPGFCPRCDGSGRQYPLRRDVLAEAFRDGGLPEQNAGPATLWCSVCRPGGTFKNCKHGYRMHDTCHECERTTCEYCQGRTTIRSAK